MILSFFLTFVFCTFAIPLKPRQAPLGVPDYVVKYAPIVYLHSSDPYRPADIGNQLAQTHPLVNYMAMSGGPQPLTLENLHELNNVGGKDVYLTSMANVENSPSWIRGVEPDSAGKTNGAVSCAIIVNDHGNGLVDVFYMYFYAFDYGGTYFGFTIGNHVADWEHNMIRFRDGIPQAIWYSQHSNGQAFHYGTVNKYDDGMRVSNRHYAGLSYSPLTFVAANMLLIKRIARQLRYWWYSQPWNPEP